MPDLIATKLHIPVFQGQWMARARLVKMLQAGLGEGIRLVLISAPAGFGKTTLVSEWAASSPGVRFAWLSLDEADSDPVRFWSYLLAALQKACPDLSMPPVAGLQSPAGVQALVTGLVNAFAQRPDLTVLVLDDYHTLHNPDIHSAVGSLLAHLPAGLRLALATRADPPIALSQLRARGQMVELRARQLQFDSQEARVFLRQAMGLELTDDEVRLVEERTEGWAAGLHLAALSIQAHTDRQHFLRSFSGTSRYILDYLAEEVLSNLSSEVHSFLLRTSILAQLNADLCEAVLSDHPPLTGSQAMLEYLDRANLFVISLDDQGVWYRYHHLFAGLLAKRLAQAHPGQLNTLHRRAAAWHASQGYYDEAVKHGLKSEDYAWTAGVIEQAARANMLNGRVATLLSWVSSLPEDVLQAHPRLEMYQAWAHFLHGAAARAHDQLLRIKASLKALPQAARPAWLLGEVNTYLGTLASLTASPEELVAISEEALADLPEHEKAPRARVLLNLGTAYGLQGDMPRSNSALSQAAELSLAAGSFFLHAHILETLAANSQHAGQLHEAAGWYQHIIQLSKPGTPTVDTLISSPPTAPGDSPAGRRYLAGLGYLGLAALHLEWNHLEQAGQLLDQGGRLCREGGIQYNQLTSLFTKALLAKARYEPAEASTALARAQQIYVHLMGLPAVVYLGYFQTVLRLDLSSLDRCPHWSEPGRTASLYDLPLEAMPVSVREFHLMTLARLHLAAGRSDLVPALHAQLLASPPAGRLARRIEMDFLLALALFDLGELEPAAHSLAQSLTLAAPSGYLRLYLNEGEAARRLFRAAQPLLQGEAALYGNKVLQAWVEAEPVSAYEQPSKPDTVPAQNASVGLVEPLTARELEVLRWMEQGLSNQEIAEGMVVSVNTVKKHSANLFGKLGVTRRTQAILEARRLGIL